MRWAAGVRLAVMSTLGARTIWKNVSFEVFGRESRTLCLCSRSSATKLHSNPRVLMERNARCAHSLFQEVWTPSRCPQAEWSPAVAVAAHRIRVAHREGSNHTSPRKESPAGHSGLALHMPVLWYGDRAQCEGMGTKTSSSGATGKTLACDRERR